MLTLFPLRVVGDLKDRLLVLFKRIRVLQGPLPAFARVEAVPFLPFQPLTAQVLWHQEPAYQAPGRPHQWIGGTKNLQLRWSLNATCGFD